MRHPRAYVALCMIVLGTAASSAQPAAPVGDVVSRLRELGPVKMNGWRFHYPAVAGGEHPGFDDSKWRQVNPEHRWEHENAAAWYRKLIVIPEAVGGVPVTGQKVELRVAVDDDSEVYVNGKLVGKFHWDQGRVTLSEAAEAGQNYLVAVKAINQGGPGRLLSATLHYDRLDQVATRAHEAADVLAFASRLVAAAEHQGREVTNPLDASARAIRFEALAGGDTEAFEASLQRAEELLRSLDPLAKQYTIHLVGHAHIDMNWLWLWPETVEVCRRTWTQAVKFMDEFPEFCFSQSQPGAYIAIQQQDPELFAQMQRYAREGRWDITGGTWVEGDTNMASGEALVRQLLLSREYFLEHFGKAPEIGWLPDNFGHAWTVPTIFADAGLKYYYFCRCGKGIPMFWWEGPDGSRLLAYNYRWYNDRAHPGMVDIPLQLEEKSGIKRCMFVYGVGDHGGGPTRRDLERIAAYRARPLAPKFRFSTASQFYEAALAEKQDFPVIRDELNFTFQGCYTSQSENKRQNRLAENRLPVAEMLSVFAEPYGVKYPYEALRQGWRNTCFDQFHDIFCGSAIHGSYEYSTGLFEQTMGAVDSAMAAASEALLARIETEGEGIPIVVFNPVGWRRDEFVTATVRTAQRAAGFAVRDSRGREVPVQILDRRQEGEGHLATLGFVARELPSLGYEVYRAIPGERGRRATPPEAAPEGVCRLASDRWTADLDKSSGALRAAVCRPSGRKLLVKGEAGDLLEVLMEAPHGMSAWNIGRIVETVPLDRAERVEILEHGPVRTRAAVVHRFRDSVIRQYVSVYEGLPRLDFDLDINWQEVADNSAPAPMLKVAFPLALENPTAHFEIPFGVMERAPTGAEVPGQKWVDVAAQELRVRGSAMPFEPLDLTWYFNADGVATEKNPGDGDFDHGGRCYPAGIFAGAQDGRMVLEGRPYLVPPLADGMNNMIRCEGQTLKLRVRPGSALHILGASSNGAHGGLLGLRYEDGQIGSARLSFSDWCFGPGADETDALQLGYRLDRNGRTEPTVHVWQRTVSLDPERTLVAVTLPAEADLHLFAITAGAPVDRRTVRGVALLNDCKYGHDVTGSRLRLTLLRTSYAPDPVPEKGRHVLRYALLPHEGDWREGRVMRRAYEFNRPVIAYVAAPHGGELPARYSFVSLQPANLVLVALKRAEDGEGSIVRFFEAHGEKASATMSFSRGVASAVETNCVEVKREGSTLRRLDAHTVTLEVGPHQIKTLRIRWAE